MNLRIVVVGKLKEKYFREAEQEYLKRLRPYCRLSIVELKNSAQVEKHIAGTGPSDRIVALDERGDNLSSRQFAEELVQPFLSGELTGELLFLIGGADGHSEEVRRKAARLIAFGKLTWPHRLMRVALAEQIYRAVRICRGEPYHRD